jgi:FkbM family methyltransferase
MRLTELAKAVIRKAANLVGYDFVPYDAYNVRWRLARLLTQHRITMVFDVGANLGHFAWDMRELGYHGRIISFEPLSDAFAQLRDAARGDDHWQVVHIGLGDRDENREINIAGNSQSSSFLPMLDAHRNAAPDSAYSKMELASIRRLDAVFAEYCSPEDIVFLKIDTQGFEKFVLDGASGVLHAIPLIQLECSLVPLYEGSLLIEEMIAHMRGLGYVPVDSLPIFFDPDTGNMLQSDMVFARRA